MNWIKNFIRPKIQGVFSKKDAPVDLWSKCPGCGGMLYHRDLAEDDHCCRECGYHFRLSAAARLKLLFDAGSWTLLDLPPAPEDPLKFRDLKRYRDRLRAARKANSMTSAVLAAKGRIHDIPAVLAVQDFSFLGGSLGMAEGAAIAAGAKAALADGVPYIVCAAAGGARMQEGILALMQMARTTAALAALREAGLPYLVILTHPTTGGVTASYGMTGDIHIAEPGALIGFAGPRVIEQTIRQTLPEGFQSAEYLLEHGMVDMVVPRKELRGVLAQVLSLLASGRQKQKASRSAQIRASVTAERRLALAARRRR